MTETAELEARLREKEDLVAALTERLEQAAEQLDRLRRTGADRGGRAGSGMTSELAERQQQLTEDLQRAVGQWEEMQPAATLARIEDRIAELRDLIRVEIVDGGLAAPRESQSGASGRQPATAGPETGPADSASREAASSHSSEQSSRWEALKAELLGGESPASDGANKEGAGIGPESEATRAGTSTASQQPGEAIAAQREPADDRQSQEPVEPVEPVDPPAPVDFDSAGTEELREAVETRDEYIAYLIKKLRIVDARSRLPDNWEQLENLPDELRERVQQLHDQLEEKLRLAEVEHSLERARLAREASRLTQLEEETQATLQRLLEMAPEEREEHLSPQGQKSGSRWLRLLGIGRGPDDEEDEEQHTEPMPQVSFLQRPGHPECPGQFFRFAALGPPLAPAAAVISQRTSRRGPSCAPHSAASGVAGAVLGHEMG